MTNRLDITRRVAAALVVCTAAAGCSDDDDSMNNNTGQIAQPVTYTFESRFQPGESSVAYSGQTKRHLLIETIKSYIGGLDDQTFTDPQPGDVTSSLVFFYDFSNEGGDPSADISLSPGVAPALQQTWGDLGSLASLQEKFPEVDADFMGNIVGYGEDMFTPEGALFDMFDKLEALILARANGNLPTDPSGADIAVPYVSAEGIDYQQLIQKYLTGAVAFSQGTDDYLDDDIDGKGLLSDNTMAGVSGGQEQTYTALEHVWDEGFGYFGAARNYDAYSDDEISSAGGRTDWQGAQDTDGDGSIDYQSEYNFGHAVNAAKRDRGAMVATDYTQTAFDAFLAGRTLIVNAGGNLSADQLAELQGYRDTAVGAWERAIAATVVHYINDVLQDMGDFGSDEYSFLDHAKHWSEMKGFALALQFNVNHSPMSATQLASLHDAFGNSPALPGADATAISDYQDSLNMAKDILRDAYGFDAGNMGDAAGENGW